MDWLALGQAAAFAGTICGAALAIFIAPIRMRAAMNQAIDERVNGRLDALAERLGRHEDNTKERFDLRDRDAQAIEERATRSIESLRHELRNYDMATGKAVESLASAMGNIQATLVDVQVKVGALTVRSARIGR